MSEEPKKETVRITLPPRPANGIGGGVIKHETVRITTSASSPAATVAPPPGHAALPTPLAPPPKPLGAGLPPKPLGAGLPPKPLGANLPPRPVAPLAPKPPAALNAAPPPVAPKPTAPGVASAPASFAPKPAGNMAPLSVKPSPKKETARIQSPAGPKPLPQATLKLQQTQPAAQSPAATVKSTGAITQPPVLQKQESLLFPGLVFLVSLIAFCIQLWTFVS